MHRVSDNMIDHAHVEAGFWMTVCLLFAVFIAWMVSELLMTGSTVPYGVMYGWLFSYLILSHSHRFGKNYE